MGNNWREVQWTGGEQENILTVTGEGFSKKGAYVRGA